MLAPLLLNEGGPLAKPNYQYEKRQKEIAKKAKQEEKRRQKLKAVPNDDSPKDSVSELDVTPHDEAQQ
jgi:hypothetical protein